MFSAMGYEPGTLSLIDQRLLPVQETWLRCTNLEDVANAIEDMVVRGAPAIGCAAAYGLAIEARGYDHQSPWGEFRGRFETACSRMAATRPTAVNLFYALDRMRDLSRSAADGDLAGDVAAKLEALAGDLFEDDLATCRAIGHHGAGVSGGQDLRVLTHCNTGSLATAGYGTALGVIRALHERGQIKIVYADETRPYLQGARLTAFELHREGIPYKVVVDSTAAWLMQRRQVDLVVVGADRIAANGDTANKIGTYSLAVHCKHHGVPFYVAAPLSTFDVKLTDGSQIPVEERSAEEVRLAGGKQMTPIEAPVYNPSFDVTPHELITGIITEKGVLTNPFEPQIRRLLS